MERHTCRQIDMQTGIHVGKWAGKKKNMFVYTN